MQGLDCLPTFLIPAYPRESDGLMAVSEKDFRELSSAVAEIKGSWNAMRGFAAASVIVGLAASGWCWHLGNKVTAIEQQLADGGSTKLVAELKAPKSPEQLQANLTTVSGQLQTARVEGKEPDHAKLATLSGALSQVVQHHPDLPEAWQAAIQLVDYKFQAPIRATSLPDCLDTLPPNNEETDRLYTPTGQVDYPNFSGPQTQGWMSHVFLAHCQLNLDDNGDFDSTSVGKFFQKVRAHHPQATLFVLVLNDAHITYSGGKMLPMSGIQFTNCTFEFKPPSGVPSKISQSITTQLLAADTSQGTIQLPTGL